MISKGYLRVLEGIASLETSEDLMHFLCSLFDTFRQGFNKALFSCFYNG